MPEQSLETVLEPSAPPPSCSYAQTLVFVVLLLLFWTTSFLVQATCAVLTSVLLLCGGRERLHHIQSFTFRFWNSLALLLNPLWRLRVVSEVPGTPLVPASAGGPGTLLIVNHRSNLDPWVMARLLQKSCVEARFCYKASLGKIPIAGWCCVLAGDLPAHFGNKDRIGEMLERSRALLSQGYNIVVFPEGTRSPSGVLQDFKPTFFNMAAELGCPVVPVCLFGTERAWPAGGFKMGCANMTAFIGRTCAPVEPGAEGARMLMDEVVATYKRLAGSGVQDACVDADDPMLTGQPYRWWRRPGHMEQLSGDEVLALLKSGKGHERGAGVA